MLVVLSRCVRVVQSRCVRVGLSWTVSTVEEAEIDQLRRRLEDTERAMERIMQQMSSVSHKLNAARISSNIRALKEVRPWVKQ